MKHQRQRTKKREISLMYEYLPVPEREDIESMRKIIDFMLSLPENKEKEIVPVALIGERPDYEVLFKVGQYYRKEFAEILFETIDSAIPFCVLSFKRRQRSLALSPQKILPISSRFAPHGHLH
ncbi:MAG: hypothetical protein NUV49_03660 [Patescibacteria group bacterium]|nr:hypothetical protein [Patescibacteria group bacterium]